MKRRALACALVLVVGAVYACGPVDFGSGSLSPVNECPQISCVAYKQTPVPGCVSGSCLAQVGLENLTLVVSLPQGNYYAPNRTFVMKSAAPKVDSSGRATPPGCLAFPGKGTTCLLPRLGELAGSYAADTQTARTVAFNLNGSDPNAAKRRSVPIQTTFRPAWAFVDALPSVDMGLLGIGVQPTFGTSTTGNPANSGLPGPILASGVEEPNLGFDVVLPAGSYEETRSPLPPYDSAFPPVIRRRTELQGLSGVVRDPSALDNFVFAEPVTVDSYPVSVWRLGSGDLSSGDGIDGWSLFLRDHRTQRRISTLLTTHESADVVLQAYGLAALYPDADFNDIELVLRPKPEARMPDLVVRSVGGTVPAKAPYPLVYKNVTVSGFVAGEDGEQVAANIVLEALPSQLAIPDADDPDQNAKDLTFSDEFGTRPDGTYSRSVPPGKYAVILTPDPLSGYARTVIASFSVSPTTGGSGNSQEGKKLQLVRPVVLQGTCVTVDGRPLSGAEVDVKPSASLLYTTSTTLQDSDPRRWPRPVTAHTDAAGNFAAPVDPDGIYDVVVRPANGTRFPWTVRQEVAVAASGVPLQISVPAPTLFDFVLEPPDGAIPAAETVNPAVSGALVRAFVGKCLGTPQQCSCAAGQTPGCVPGHPHFVGVEIGRGLSDEGGRVQLFLDPTALSQ